jgi:hypothetical protein
MKEALAKALTTGDERIDNQVDRILATAFFRPRPLQAGSVATVVSLDARRTDVRRSHFS